MVCDLPPAECAIQHLAPNLGLRCRQEGAVWAGPCPACGGSHCLTLTIEGRRKLWHCNRRPQCSQEAVLSAVAAVLPGCISPPRRARKPARPADPDELITLILDRSVTGNALRLGLLRMLGMTTAEAAGKLGMPKSTRYDALRILGRPRR
jgi:ssDNA-binding Zn-finger/Zn-ribbon topoisomerase 1